MVMTSRSGSGSRREDSAIGRYSSGLERRIAGADDVLVEVDVRAGHQAGFVGGEIGAGARDFLRIDQAAERAAT